MPVDEPQVALSMDYFIGRILSRFGASNRKVEIKGLDMAKVIAEDTLPLYSKFFPWEYLFDITTESAVPGRQGFYFITAPTAIMSVARIVGGLSSQSAIGNIGGVTTSTYQADVHIGSRGIAFSLMDAMNQNTLNAATSLPVTTRFWPPQTLEITPKGPYNGNVAIINCIHPVTLHTIPWNMADEFFQRALTDVCLSLRGLRRKFERINTIYGEINLSMEDIDKEADKDAEITEKWRAWAPKRANRKRWFVG